MMSPWCGSGCAERDDCDSFHYYYHVKSADIGDAQRHKYAADWLLVNDLQGADPYELVADIFRRGRVGEA